MTDANGNSTRIGYEGGEGRWWRIRSVPVVFLRSAGVPPAEEANETFALRKTDMD